MASAGRVAETRIRTNLVTVTAPTLDPYLRIGPISEPLQAQARVAELAAEVIAETVPPGLVRFTQCGLDVGLCQPSQQGRRDEVRSLIGPQAMRRAVAADQGGQHLNYASRADAAGDVGFQAVTTVPIDNR